MLEKQKQETVDLPGSFPQPPANIFSVLSIRIYTLRLYNLDIHWIYILQLYKGRQKNKNN